MSADVLMFEARVRALSAEQLRDFLANDTYRVLNEVTVWWGSGADLLVATNDRVLAALAADELVRRQVGDLLYAVLGTVAVSEPMSVELLPAEAAPDGFQAGDKTAWQRASRPAKNTVLVCRVWAGEDGAP